MSHLDEFFDLVFVVTLAHIGVKYEACFALLKCQSHMSLTRVKGGSASLAGHSHSRNKTRTNKSCSSVSMKTGVPS